MRLTEHMRGTCQEETEERKGGHGMLSLGLGVRQGKGIEISSGVSMYCFLLTLFQRSAILHSVEA